MPAQKIYCKVTEKTWLTPSVIQLRFITQRKFRFEAGQFLSLIIPQELSAKPARRIYSISSAPHQDTYELCVKYIGGVGTEFVKNLEVDDKFYATAPYGDFVYRTPHTRKACFIATGTGIAPLKSMILSKQFQKDPPENATMLFGAATADEIIYPGLFKKLGLTEVNAVTRDPKYLGFKGRVTDYLKSLPADWDWQGTDFYMCGSGGMVSEVARFLTVQRGVPESAIHQEVYFVSTSSPAETQIQPPALAEMLRKTG